MTSDEHAWLLRIETKIDRLEESVSRLTAYGCSQAPRHDDHEKRIRAVENTMAENHGKGIVVGAVISAVISILAVYFGKIFK